MLRITISRDASGAERYFVQALTVDDYFFREKTIMATWQGKAAALLGLANKEVDKETFSRLAHNQHPETGERLTVRNVSNRRAGYDYTFNVPKSVSIVYAITGDENILKAIIAANEAAMKEIEANAVTQGYKDGQKVYEPCGNAVWGSFLHKTSRPVATEKDGERLYIPDINIHIHNFLMNATWNEAKNRFQALEEGPLRTLAPYYESYFHSYLSKDLEDKGYRIERTNGRYEIKGITKPIRDKYSHRTLEIEKLAKEQNITDAKEKASLGARTRNKKNKSVEEDKLYDLWKERLSPEELKIVQSAKGAKKSDTDKITAKEAINKSIQHFLERNSAVPEKRVLGRAMELGYGVLTPDEVKKEFASRENILRAEKQSITYITTKELVADENRMIEYAVQSKGLHPALNPDYQIQQDFLNEEQRTAIHHLLNSQDGVSVLMGKAGVGKSTLLSEVRNGIEQAGKPLIAVAPSAEASRGVLQSKGFKDSDTIASLLKNQQMQEKLQGGVLLVDEAGMVGVKTMNDLFQLAEKQQARIILSGDTQQHTSVEFGDALRLLQEKAQLETTSVNTIVRQKNEPYRRAVEELAQGNTLKGYEKLDKMGAVKEIEDTDQRQDEIAKAYLESIKKGQSVLIVSPTHAEGQALSEIVRQKLKDGGIIKGEEKLFETQRNLYLTEAEKQDAASYYEGQVVQFHQNQKGGFKAGSRYEVMPRGEKSNIQVKSLDTGETLTLPLDKTDNFGIYQKTQTPLAEGDQLRITNNGKTLDGKTLDGKTKINNGQTYEVKGFDESGNVKLSNGKCLSRDYANFTHAYVNTSYGSQGKDAQHLILSQSSLSFAASNDKQAYVSASRGIDEISIYTDNKADLKQAIQRSGDRMSANEVAEQAHRRQMQQKRREYYKTQNEHNLGHGKEYGRQQPQGKVSPERGIAE